MPRPLINATAHDQSAHAERFAALGWLVEGPPRLGRVAPDPALLAAEAERVAAAIPPRADVLLGGLGFLCDALALLLLPRGARLHTVLTHRVSDSAGRFQFTGPVAVVETPLSHAWHLGQLRGPE